MSGIKKSMANIFVIVGGSHSGKDEIIRAIQDLGGLHAQIIPKFTSRLQQEDDEKEIKCNYAFLTKLGGVMPPFLYICNTERPFKIQTN